MLLFLVITAQAQANTSEEQLSCIGMTLAQLIERFGVPRTVAAARGNEVWQDDVVFQYDAGDFYIHRERVWQVRFGSAYGISNGDRKSVAMLVLGNTAEDRGDHVLLPISGRSWPMMLRVNFNNNGLVSAIYIYRTDY